MTEAKSATWVYNQTIKLFAAGAEPAFEDPGEQERTWGAPGASTTTSAASARS
jgi:hypothetical protein